MAVLLRQLSNLPPSDTYQYWLAIGSSPDNLEPDRQIPDLASRLEHSFDDISQDWLKLSRKLGTDKSAGLAHTPACVTNASDMGQMMAWSQIVSQEAASPHTTLVICDDAWMFRHLCSIADVTPGRQPEIWWKSLRRRIRGYAARVKCAGNLCLRTLILRGQKSNAPSDGSVVLVYGHPTSTADGRDGYFGDLLSMVPSVTRLLHVDCDAPQARALEGKNRTVSLHAWGRLRDAFGLIFTRWRASPEHKSGNNGLLVRRAESLEGATAQAAMIAWQQKCQRRWLNETRPKIVSWPWENHSWERDFVRAARAAGVRTVGYQHSVVGRQMLNYSPASNPDGFESLPDLIVCTGLATHKQLLDWGVPAQRMTIGGALRIPVLQKTEPDPKGPVFMALPYDAGTADQMVEAARALIPRGYRFLIKDHPMTPFEFRSEPGLDRTHKPFFDHTGLRAVVYVSSTLGLEAALAGLPTIRFRPVGWLKLDILPPDVILPATDGSNLGQTLERAKAPNLSREQIFSPVSNEFWQGVFAHD